ncbi:MAG: TonB-dependent receptor domain-containing protein [Parashewanella sp.]
MSRQQLGSQSKVASTIKQPLRASQLAVCICFGLFGTTMATDTFAAQISQQQQQSHSFNIQAGSLSGALTQYSRATGVFFSGAGKLTDGKHTSGLKGSYTPAQALQMLLKGSNIQYQFNGNSVALFANGTAGNDRDIELSAVRVTGEYQSGEDRDEAGYNAVFDEDASTSFIGKKDIERFKGTDPADIFKGLPNTFSGDPHAGGGIDPNIRGFQGTGRVPVTIDGTEQAITAWNGYRGASNRSYIDPNLIGNVTVHKGPSLDPDAHTSVGGGVEIKTLSAIDIIDKGDTFGMEFTADTSSNSTSVREPTLYHGQDIREVKDKDGNFIYRGKGRRILLNGDPALQIKPRKRSGSSDNLFNGQDNSFRLAVAKRGNNWDILGAYAYRKKGNYFSGTKGAGFYQQPDTPHEFGFRQPVIEPEHIGLSHLPGEEVPNTSNEMKSFLLKTSYNISDDQKLQFGARYTDAKVGEILASRSAVRSQEGTLSQWTLGKTKLQAYNLDYRWNPENPLLNIKAKLWTTLSDTATNNSGGTIHDYKFRAPESDPDKYTLFNGAIQYSKGKRYGLNFSNKMQFTDSLNLTVATRYQYQNLQPKSGVLGGGRAGTRKEFNGSFKFDWQPVEFLRLNAGARYGHYSLRDDYVINRKAAGKPEAVTPQTIGTGKVISFTTRETYTAEEIQAKIDAAVAEIRAENKPDELEARITDLENQIAALTADPFFPPPVKAFLLADLNRQLAEARTALNDFDGTVNRLIAEATARINSEKNYEKQNTKEWLRDSNGKLSRADNPCLSASEIERLRIIPESCRTSGTVGQGKTAMQSELKGSGWMPEAQATFIFSDNSRSYIRYAESLRFPSLFEGTYGFSATYNPNYTLKPERASIVELAYIHNFDNLSTKITYFDQSIDDVMDRSQLYFTNMEKQRISGLEFQSRYDNGSLFADLGLAYNLKNQVCDAGTAAEQSFVPNKGFDIGRSQQTCVRAGFAGGTGNGYLAARAVPPLSGNLLVGVRLLDKDLETGMRINYASKSHDDDPVKRAASTTVDAYVNYQVKDFLSFELTGTNLGNRYYVEPMSITSHPAPGRTFKLGMKVKF